MLGTHIIVAQLFCNHQAYFQYLLEMCIRDRYKGILAMPWGEITLLAYKESYVPYALFHTQVWENEARQGPKLLMFPQDATDSEQPFSIVEGPPRLWVNGLLDQFRP